MVEIPRESKDRLYSGPYVVERGGPPGERWVWVANGIRPTGQVFDPPRTLREIAEEARYPFGDDPRFAWITESERHARWDDPDTDGSVDEGDDEDAPSGGDEGSELAAHQLTEPVEGDGPIVEVRVLGPVEVVGWRAMPERAVVTELACYLALHADRAIPGDELRTAFRPDEEQETSAKTLRTYMSLLRKALGPDLVPAASGAGYRLSPAVTTDWHRFRALAGPTAETPDLHEALSLVRGRPFAGVAAGTFGWVYAELLVSDMEVVIAGAAQRLVEAAMATGDLEVAAWATRQGLAGVPFDLGLWQLHLAVASHQGPTFLDRARRDAEAALGGDARDLV